MYMRMHYNCLHWFVDIYHRGRCVYVCIRRAHILQYCESSFTLANCGYSSGGTHVKKDMCMKINSTLMVWRECGNLTSPFAKSDTCVYCILITILISVAWWYGTRTMVKPPLCRGLINMSVSLAQISVRKIRTSRCLLPWVETCTEEQQICVYVAGSENF